MARLVWYVRRLRSMSPAEICWRMTSLGRAATAGLRRAKSDAQLLGGKHPDWPAALAAFRAGADRPVLLDRARAAEIASADPSGVAAVVAAADRIVAGRVQYFGYPETVLEQPVDWNHDPVAGTRWPAIAATRLDHRSAPGDAKWIWELNRLQHLPWLAEAWLFTGDERYAEVAFAHLDSWLEQNPPGIGVAWRGAFEAGIRLVSVAVALQGLRDCELLTVARYRGVMRLVSESMHRCWTDRSRYSSANNHLVGELAGLAVGALLHPELAGSERALARALGGLAREAELQILPDGAGAEQALAYQLFTADLMLVVAALLRLADRPVPPTLTAALRRSAGYLVDLAGTGDPVLRYGDDDEGFALRLDVEPTPEVALHLGAVGTVTGDARAAGFGRAGITAAWFGGTQTAPAIGTAAAPSSRYFADGGLVLLRCGDRRLTMDVGPLGYLAIAAHGHADALSVTLSVAGEGLIGDPGAGSYYGHPDWRAAHRSTAAHATVSIDRRDQSVTGGAFLWTAKARTTVHGVDLEAGIVDAEHDGYQRLEQPVRHRRWLIAPPEEATVLIVDQVAGSGPHEVRTGWPLYPDLDAAPTADCTGYLVSRAGQPVLHVSHAATAPVQPAHVRADEDSALGWWSERLESRWPAWLIGAEVRAGAPVVIATTLHPAGRQEPPAGLTVRSTDDRIVVTWLDGSRLRSVMVHTARPAAVDRIVDQTAPASGSL